MRWLVFSKVSDTVIQPASLLVKIRPRKAYFFSQLLKNEMWKGAFDTKKCEVIHFDMNNSKSVSQSAPGRIWAKWNTYSSLFSLSGDTVYLNPMFVTLGISCIIYSIKIMSFQVPLFLQLLDSNRPLLWMVLASIISCVWHKIPLVFSPYCIHSRYTYFYNFDVYRISAV